MEDSSHVREAEQAPPEGNITIKIEQADYSLTISKTRKRNGFQIKLSEVRPEKNITFLHESDMDKITLTIKSLGDCDTIDELIKTFATMIAKGNPSVIKKDEQYYLAFEVITLVKKRTYELDLEKHEPVNQIATIQKDIADIKQQLDKYKAISEELLKKVNANENTNYKEYVDKTIEDKINALEHKFTQDLKKVDDTYNNTIANTKNELLERINGINTNGHPATKELLKELNKTKQKHSDEEQIIQDLIQEVNTLKDDNNKKDTTITQIRKEITDTTQETNTSKEQNKVKVDNIKKEISNIQAEEIKELIQEVNTLKTDNNKKDTTITQITKEINNLIKEVNTLKTDNNKKDTIITQTNNEIKELKQEINTLKADNNKKDTTITQINKGINDLIKELNKVKDDNIKKDTSIKELTKELNIMTTNNINKDTSINELSKEINILKDKSIKDEITNKEITNELNIIKTKHKNDQELNKLINEHETKVKSLHEYIESLRKTIDQHSKIMDSKLGTNYITLKMEIKKKDVGKDIPIINQCHTYKLIINIIIIDQILQNIMMN